jgi:hypothetical protein
MTLRRTDDWESRLAEFFRARRDVPFEFGVNDCGLFACDAVLAMTGVDLGAGVRGTYQDTEGERVALQKIAAEHALEEIPVRMARRGDVVLFERAEGPTLLVVGLDGVNAYGPGENGIKSIPVKHCSKAWRI